MVTKEHRKLSLEAYQNVSMDDMGTPKSLLDWVKSGQATCSIGFMLDRFAVEIYLSEIRGREMERESKESN